MAVKDGLFCVYDMFFAVAYTVYAQCDTNTEIAINQRIAPLVGAYCIRPELRGLRNVATAFAYVFMRWRTGHMQYAPTYMPCAIKNNMHRSNDFGKTKFVCFFKHPGNYNRCKKNYIGRRKYYV